MDANAALSAIDRYGIPIVALVVVAGFAWWLIKTWQADQRADKADLRAVRDRGLDISERQVGATEALTIAVTRLVDQRVADNEKLEALTRSLDRFMDRRRT